MVSKAGAASAGSVKNSPNMLTLPPPFVLIESGPSQPHAMAVSLSLSLSVSLSLSTVLPLKKNKKRKKKETVSDIFKEDSRTKRRCVHDQGHRNRDEVEELRSVGLGCFRVHDSNVPEDES